VQCFHSCRQDRRACGRQHRQDEPSAMGWNVEVLLHEYALGLACQVRQLQRSRRQEGHQQTAVEAVCANVASSCPRKRKLLTHDDLELLTRRSCSNRMKTRTSCSTKGAAARRSCVASSPHNQFCGMRFSEPYEEVDVVGNIRPLHPLW